jgi:hypothetical protein
MLSLLLLLHCCMPKTLRATLAGAEEEKEDSEEIKRESCNVNHRCDEVSRHAKVTHTVQSCSRW